MAERVAARSRRRVRSPEQAFGDVLREIRLRQGVSQESLAHASGYHRTYIGQLERPKRARPSALSLTWQTR